MSSDSADPFYWMRVILASNRGMYFFSFASVLVLTSNRSENVGTVFRVHKEWVDLIKETHGLGEEINM